MCRIAISLMFMSFVPEAAFGAGHEDWIGQSAVMIAKVPELDPEAPIVNICAIAADQIRVSNFLGEKAWIDADKMIRIENAIEYFTKQIEADPNNHRALHGRALGHIYRKDISLALVDINRAIELNSKASGYHLTRSALRSINRDYVQAIADSDRAIELSPQSAAALALRAYILFSKQEYEKAIIEYSNAISINAESGYLYYHRGWARCLNKQFQSAIDDLSNAIRLEPHQMAALYVRASAWEHLNQREKVIDDFTEIIRLDRTNAIAHYYRGIQKQLLAKNDEASDDYSKAIHFDPKNIEYRLHRGAFFETLSEFDKAVADYSEAIRINPMDVRARERRAKLWFEMKRYYKAEEDWKAVIENEPGSINARFGLAWLWATCPYSSSRNGEKAVEFALLANKASEGKSWEHVLSVAAAYAETGEFDKAVAWSERAVLASNNDQAKKLCQEAQSLFRDRKPYRLDQNTQIQLSSGILPRIQHCPPPWGKSSSLLLNGQ